MVTVRTYWNQAEAAFAESLLDDYEIFCALIHENAHLYGRAPFAMPIRLVVDEDQADRAIHILNGDLEKAAEIDASDNAAEMSVDSAVPPEAGNQNPWELLVLAFYLVVPAICVLGTKYPTIVATSSRARYVIARATVAHFLSWIAVAFATVLVGLYFRVRRSSVKSQTAE
jgi:hypothetical protein